MLVWTVFLHILLWLFSLDYIIPYCVKGELFALYFQEALRKKHEREEALQKYNSAKKESFKKLCKKTHKGQPVMKNQIEYLLAKIEKQVNQT